MNEERFGYLADDQIMQLTIAMRYYDRQQEEEIVDALTVQGLTNMEIFYRQLSERIAAHRRERVQKLFGTPEGLEYAAEARIREQVYQESRAEYARLWGNPDDLPRNAIELDPDRDRDEDIEEEEEE
jgi:hypothetical protein